MKPRDRQPGSTAHVTTTPDESDDLTARVVSLRREKGWTFHRIGKELDIAAPTAFYHWKKAITMRQQQMFADIDHIRTEQLEEIEQQVERLHAIIEDGGDEALAAESLLIKLREQKAKLMGTHAPIKVEGETSTRFIVTVEGVRSWHDEAEGTAPGDTDD